MSDASLPVPTIQQSKERKVFPLITRYINEKECYIKWDRYSNGRIAMQIKNVLGEAICMASVNLPYVSLPNGCVFIKDYSENEGLLAALEQAGVVERTDVEVPTGFVTVFVCKLLVEFGG
jgi:hypothetical protein